MSIRPILMIFISGILTKTKRLYAIVGRNVHLCIPSRVFAVGRLDSVGPALPRPGGDRQASSGVVFERVDQSLVISTGRGEPSRQPFTAGVETAERHKFIDRLDHRQVDFRRKQGWTCLMGWPARCARWRRGAVAFPRGTGRVTPKRISLSIDIPPILPSARCLATTRCRRCMWSGSPKAPAPRFSLRPPIRRR